MHWFWTSWTGRNNLFLGVVVVRAADEVEAVVQARVRMEIPTEEGECQVTQLPENETVQLLVNGLILQSAVDRKLDEPALRHLGLWTETARSA